MGRWVSISFDTRWGHGQYPSETCRLGNLTSACAQVATRYQCPTSFSHFSLLVLNMLLTHVFLFLLPRTTRWSYQRLERLLAEKGEEEKEEQSACVGIKIGVPGSLASFYFTPNPFILFSLLCKHFFRSSFSSQLLSIYPGRKRCTIRL